MPRVYGGEQGERDLKRRTDAAEAQWWRWLAAMWIAQGKLFTPQVVGELRSGTNLIQANISQQIIDITKKTLADNYDSSMRTTTQIIGQIVASHIDDYTYNPMVLRTTQYIQEQGAALVVQITDGQRETIRQILIRANRNNLTIPQLATQLRERIGLTKRYEQALANYERRLTTRLGYKSLSPKQAARLEQALIRDGIDRRTAARIARAAQGRGLAAGEQRLLTERLTGRKRQQYLRLRSNNIARTETARAWNREFRQTIRDAAAQGKFGNVDVTRTWYTALDERVCFQCGPHHGETVPVNDEFSGGDEPGAIHPSCRCTQTINTKRRR